MACEKETQTFNKNLFDWFLKFSRTKYNKIRGEESHQINLSNKKVIGENNAM